MKALPVSRTVAVSSCVQQLAARGRLAVQGKVIPSDGLNRMSACYCPSFSLFCSPSWLNSDFAQIFFVLRDTEITRVKIKGAGALGSESTVGEINPWLHRAR